MARFQGLKKCEDAFERLVNGRPDRREHVGVRSADITPSMVSVEAGFDKGYLKRSRGPHRPLIARIGSLSGGVKAGAQPAVERISRALSAAEKAKANEAALKEILDKVLTQNLMLVERVRELEASIHGTQRRIG